MAGLCLARQLYCRVILHILKTLAFLPVARRRVVYLNIQYWILDIQYFPHAVFPSESTLQISPYCLNYLPMAKKPASNSKKTGKIIRPITVKDILDEQIAYKLA